MGHSRIRAKVRRRRVAILAAKSRQFDVKNHMKRLGNVETVEFQYNKESTPIKVTKQSGKLYIREGFGTVYLPRGENNPPFEIKQHGRYLEISDKPNKLGMRFHLPDHSWKYERHKQPKSLMRYKKRKHTGEKIVTNSVGCTMRVYDIKRHKRNDFKTFFPNYPYHLPKMNKIEYMEKLVQHKLAKWERKNPRPAEENDMFKEEFVTPWLVERNRAEERIRDFVISVYDKLLLTGRFKINEHKYNEEKIAEIKDVNMEGHHINELPKSSKLLKKAQKEVDHTKAKRDNLIAGNLRDHKKQKGRIILPQAA